MRATVERELADQIAMLNACGCGAWVGRRSMVNVTKDLRDASEFFVSIQRHRGGLPQADGALNPKNTEVPSLIKAASLFCRISYILTHPSEFAV